MPMIKHVEETYEFQSLEAGQWFRVDEEIYLIKSEDSRGVCLDTGTFYTIAPLTKVTLSQGFVL